MRKDHTEKPLIKETRTHTREAKKRRKVVAEKGVGFSMSQKNYYLKPKN